VLVGVAIGAAMHGGVPRRGTRAIAETSAIVHRDGIRYA
jgi:hypothetical protein